VPDVTAAMFVFGVSVDCGIEVVGGEFPIVVQRRLNEPALR
jgi:hypothetical protein